MQKKSNRFARQKLFDHERTFEKRSNWSVNCEPAANGIMTWCGALRRITHIGGSREEIDHEELFTPSDLEDIDEIGVYGFMRND
jgi:hypothetical protein